MKTEIIMYDEGYGAGPNEVKILGMSVDEVIYELKELSKIGFGDRILFDGYGDPVTKVEVIPHSSFEIEVPRII